ncbi:DUF5994 family protein [Streptomyces viridosporus]|uniref:Uncharacterized protein n=1 Tax=Streptomyces viridosporus T7A TaxID=665577 RepID=A0ABX6A8X1_STRVD|nr:DUF5994 family protein [Streptomyces viridosporus]QEU83379.1 hypothetical protein CP969_00160 [Streptomyces viridosporus T7A]
MNVTIDHTTPRERAPSPSARLSLTPARTVPGQLNGAWWPRSRNLFRELPALVDALIGPRGQATRVTVNPARWPIIPRRVPVSGHILHVCWFTDEQHPHTLVLLSHTVGRWELLVIPPETRGAAAERLMSAAAAVGNLRTAGRLMADEEATGDVTKAQSREETWETDGGASASPPRPRPLDPTESLPCGRGR